MIRRLLKFVIPGRTDLVVLSSALMIGAGIIAAWAGPRYALHYETWTMSALYLGWWSIVSAALVALGAAVAWQCFELKPLIVMAVLCVISVVANLAVFEFSADEAIAARMNEQLPVFLELFRSVQKLKLAPLTIFPVAFLVGFAPIAIWRGISYLGRQRSKKNSKHAGRTAVLITIAGVLFTGVVLRNILSGLNSTFDDETYLGFSIMVVFCCFVHALVIAFPSWSVLCGKKFRTRRVIPACLIVFMSIATIAGFYFNYPTVRGWGVVVCTFVILGIWTFATTLLVVDKQQSKMSDGCGTDNSRLTQESRSDEELAHVDEPNADKSRRRMFGMPGLLSLTVLAFAGTLCWGANYYDADTILMNPAPANLSYAHQVAVANGNPYIEFGRDRWTDGLSCVLITPDGDEAPADVFVGLDELYTNLEFVSITGMRPDVDLTPLDSHLREVSVFDSTISIEQLELLANSKMLRLQNVSLSVLDVEPASIPMPETLVLTQMKSEYAAAVLSSMTRREQPPTFGFGRTLKLVKIPLTGEVWKEILRHSNFPVVIACGADISGAWRDAIDSDQPVDQILLSPDSLNSVDGELRALFLGTEVKIQMSVFESPAEFWRLAFMRPDSILVGNFPRDASFTVADCFGVFGRDDEGNVTHLFAPPGVSIDVDTTLIQTLSLDPHWVAWRYFAYSGPPPVVTEPFGYNGIPAQLNSVDCPQLKRLYLSERISIMPIQEIAKRFPKLEHLQFAGRNINAVGPLWTGGELPELNSVTIFAERNHGIDSDVLNWLASCSNLQDVQIVLDNHDPNGLADIQRQVQAEFPGATVTATPASTWKPDYPQEFRDHLEEVGRTLREQQPSTANPSEQDK